MRLSWWCRWGIHTWTMWVPYRNPHYSIGRQMRTCSKCGRIQDELT